CRILIILLCVCFSFSADEARSDLGARFFHSSYLNVFLSVVDAFSERGYEIENADELRGVITTTWREETTGFFSRRDIRRRLCANVMQHDEGSTEVALRCHTEIKEADTWHDQSMSSFEKKRLHRRLFRAIRDKVYAYNRWF
ncbi:hypothetical protein AMJ87_12440, partial [candidate division WOR_3 bacterium SM23_60]